MMICEQCQQEMTASLVKCEHCGYNPALQRLDAWRERRQRRMAPAVSQAPTEEARQVADNRRSSAKDATLIRFPKRPANPLPVLPTSPTTQQEPPSWRSRLDARLAEIREQRAMEVEPPAMPKPIRPAVEELDQNPIVAKALNRIQRANYLQPITPPPHSRAAVAAELAPILEIPPPAPYSEAKAATASAFARAAVAPNPHLVTEPAGESFVSAVEAEEDLLADVLLDPTPHVVTEITPIEPPTTLEPASLPKRAAAAVIDAEIIASSLLPLFGAYFFLSGWFESPTILLPITVGVALIAVYFFVTYALAGRTMGMAWCNLHLASLSTTHDLHHHDEPSTVTFTIRQAIMRALGGTITLLLFPLNVICIARNDERLSISDYLSSTQVVRIKK